MAHASPMAILHARTEWKKPRAKSETRRSYDLTPEEGENVRRALRFLRTRLRGALKLAQALKVNRVTLDVVCSAKNRRPGAALAIRAARLAGASVEDVLSGKWPPEGECPVCGRGP